MVLDKSINYKKWLEELKQLKKKRNNKDWYYQQDNKDYYNKKKMKKWVYLIIMKRVY